jgi:hypothetical protein
MTMSNGKVLNDKYAQSKSALELVSATSGDHKKKKSNFTSRVLDQSKKGSSALLT